jgi:hypothetical protein
MKIKTLWGFLGDAEKLKADSRQIRRGKVFEDVDDEYAHALIGQGLAVEVGGTDKEEAPKLAKPAPKVTKPATPSETK